MRGSIPPMSRPDDGCSPLWRTCQRAPRRWRDQSDAGTAGVCPVSGLSLPDRRRIKGTLSRKPSRLVSQTTRESRSSSSSLRRFAGRAYRLSVLVRAYEAEGGRNVAAQTSAIVSDAPFLVGVKPDGDLSYVRRSTTHQAHWLAVNKVLAPVTAENLTSGVGPAKVPLRTDPAG